MSVFEVDPPDACRGVFFGGIGGGVFFGVPPTALTSCSSPSTYS